MYPVLSGCQSFYVGFGERKAQRSNVLNESTRMNFRVKVERAPIIAPPRLVKGANIAGNKEAL